MKQNGIAVAGNMIVDVLYPILGHPKPGELTTITEGISRSTGGALCNVIVDLAKLDPELPLTALGRIGTDAEGDYVLEKLHAHSKIDTTRVLREGLTSFTAVMADTIGKQRTFYHYREAQMRDSAKRTSTGITCTPISCTSATSCCWTRWTSRTKHTEPEWRACCTPHRAGE